MSKTKIWVQWELETGWSSPFSIGGGVTGHWGGALNVAGDLAGQAIKLGTLESIEVEAEFPQPTRDPQEKPGHGFAVVTRSSEEGRPEWLAVHRLPVKAWLEVDRADPREEKNVKIVYERASQAVGAVARRLAITAAIQSNDFGLEPPEDPDPDKGMLFWGSNDLPIPYPPSGSAKAFGFRAAGSYKVALDRAWFEATSQKISSGWEPALHWSIFSEAWRALVREKTIGPAIVSAVTAVEVGLSGALRQRSGAPPEMEAMERYVRFEVLMGDVSKVVLGSSFPQKNRSAYHKIKALIKARNQIVHEGRAPQQSLTAIEGQLEAVKRFLDWIDSRLESSKKPEV
jgi:hypothetical protein